MTDFIERLMKHATNGEVLLFKRPIEQKFSLLFANMDGPNEEEVVDFEFISNPQVRREESLLDQRTQFKFLIYPICRPFRAASSPPSATFVAATLAVATIAVPPSSLPFRGQPRVTAAPVPLTASSIR